MAGIVYYKSAERPDVRLWLTDDNNALVDLSTGYTFTFKLGRNGQTAIFTKTTGITGAAGSGVQPSGTPNCTITFTAGELAAVEAKPWVAQITATTSGLDRVWQVPFTVAAVIA